MTGWLEIWPWGLALVAGTMTLAWVIGTLKRDVSVVDIFWGLGFVETVWLYHLLGDGDRTRGLVVAGAVTLWGCRLAWHIFRRSLGHGEDSRYAEIRARNGKMFWLTSLFTVFLLQATLVWIISLPLLRAQIHPEAFGLLDALGALVFVAGFAMESVADRQLQRFRNDPAMKGKVLDTGLWRYTRHPNYFGDALVWWGLFLMAPAHPWVLISPLLMTWFLMRVSGVPMLEAKLKRTRPGYADYVARTNSFFRWFPKKASARSFMTPAFARGSASRKIRPGTCRTDRAC